MGTPSDMGVRVAKQQKDNAKYRKNIIHVRKLIYAEGRAIQIGVEEVLKDVSYVPTRVRVNIVAQIIRASSHNL